MALTAQVLVISSAYIPVEVGCSLGYAYPEPVIKWLSLSFERPGGQDVEFFQTRGLPPPREIGARPDTPHHSAGPFKRARNRHKWYLITLRWASLTKGIMASCDGEACGQSSSGIATP